jgi:hypothetical protein
LPASITVVLFLLLGVSVSSPAQEPQSPPPQTQAPAPIPQPKPKAASDEPDTHFDATAYLWLGGIHGLTSVGNHSSSVHSSIGDLLSHFKFGLMGAAEGRADRWLLNGDLMWMRLGDTKAMPISDVSTASADVRVSEVIWTSKLAYRMIDGEYLKGDANVGIRYWHLGQRFKLNPPGIDASASQNWADFVIGGRVQLPVGMSEKATVEVGGDVGGWGLAADLDYQFFGGLNYKTGKHWKVAAAYRYMLIDYRRNGGVYNVVTSGPLLGATYSFK